MMDKIILIVIVVLLAGCAGTVERQAACLPETTSLQNGAEGFRGIKWGQDVSEIVGLRLVGKESHGLSIYSRDGDQLTLGEAKLIYIHYYFWMNKFSEVQIRSSSDQLQALKNVLTEKYGNGYYTYGPSSNLNDHFWSTPTVIVSLRRMVLNLDYEIWIKSKDVNNQLVRYSAQKAKKAAESGAQKDF